MDRMLLEPPFGIDRGLEIANAIGPTLATIFAAIAAGIFAWRQVVVAQNTLRLALFEKRIEFYRQAVRLIDETLIDPTNHTKQSRSDYLVLIESARWLFDQKVEDHLRGPMWAAMAQFVRAAAAYKAYQGGQFDAHLASQAAEAERDANFTITSERTAFAILIDPYMKLNT